MVISSALRPHCTSHGHRAGGGSRTAGALDSPHQGHPAGPFGGQRITEAKRCHRLVYSPASFGSALPARAEPHGLRPGRPRPRGPGCAWALAREGQGALWPRQTGAAICAPLGGGAQSAARR